jgi:hypothetical protein
VKVIKSALQIKAAATFIITIRLEGIVSYFA